MKIKTSGFARFLIGIFTLFFFNQVMAEDLKRPIFPYTPPRLEDVSPDTEIIKIFQEPEKFNYVALHTTVLRCFPSKSLFDLDLSLNTGVRHFQSDSDYFTNGAYANLLLSIPLFSSQENYRQLDREHVRREKAGRWISRYAKSLAMFSHYFRLLSLHVLVEQRSQLRIKKGVAPLAEHLEVIDKISYLYAKIATSEAELKEAELNLLSHCQNSSPEQQRLKTLFKENREVEK